jgi:phosphopantothenoylcysteine decarboxylase/phosphopantothenate--cysteine ligase
LIVANDIRAANAGFAVDTNQVTLLDPDGSSEALPLMSKTQVSQAVMERIVKLLAGQA